MQKNGPDYSDYVREQKEIYHFLSVGTSLRVSVIHRQSFSVIVLNPLLLPLLSVLHAVFGVCVRDTIAEPVL